MTMNCDKASRLMSDQHDRPLKFKERVSLKFHLMICKACDLTRRQFERIREICRSENLGDSPRLKDVKLSSEFKEKLKQKLQ